MKLTIIIAMLAFCYCGSHAIIHRFGSVQPGELYPFQPRPRRLENTPGPKTEIIECKSMMCGKEKIVRNRSLLKREGKIPGTTTEVKEKDIGSSETRCSLSQVLRLLQEYYGEPEYSSGYEDSDYGAQELPRAE